MKEIIIQDLSPGVVPGIQIQMPESIRPYEEGYFTWAESSLITMFQSNEISGGILCARKHTPFFTEIETHVDAEFFYFVSGVAVMPFIDMKDGCPDMDTAQIVRILPGTQMIISPGKAHFVAVAEGDDLVEIVVIAPKMGAPRVALPEALLGINL
jgi:hypothetical protein